MSDGSLLRLADGMLFAGDYRIVRALRSGGMGAVYIAEQQSTGMHRALKLMHPQLVADPSLRKRFEQEARIGSRIESEHVVQVISAGIDGPTGMPWLAMELLRGEDLAAYVAASGAIGVNMVQDVFEQLCHALGAAHAAGIVHRDLKPENIFLAEAKRADAKFMIKVLDFGIAKIVAEAKTTGTAALGSPMWMSPEQTSRGDSISPATDIWPLGLIVYNLLTGRSYWRTAEDATGTLATLLREIVLDPLVPASVRAIESGCDDKLPPGFDGWFARCVERNPQKRFANATEANAALKRLLVEFGPTQRDPLRPAVRPTPAASPLAPAQSRGSAPSVRRPAIAPTANDEALRVNTDLGGAYTAPDPAGAAGFAAPPSARAGKKKNRSALIAASAAVVATAVAAGVIVKLQAGSASNASSETPKPSAATSSSPSAAIAPSASSTGARPPTDEATGRMVSLSQGSFSMGAADGEEDERPVHEVAVQSFEMDVTEVTVGAWKACEAAGACPTGPFKVDFEGMTAADERGTKYCNRSLADRLDHPMNCVTWSDASAFCAWAGKRLPSEAEWEYAARGGHPGADHRAFPWGTAALDATHLNACGTECVALLWREKMLEPGESPQPIYKADDGFPTTARVGSFPKGATEIGLLDMAGNVAEWTSDWYAPYGSSGRERKTEKRVTRGGAWLYQESKFLRTTRRGKDAPASRDVVLGFRCARDPSAKK